MKKILNIGHTWAGIEVTFDTVERLFRVTTDSKGGKNERVVEFNDPAATASEVMTMAETHSLTHRLPADSTPTLSAWLERQIIDDAL